MYRNCAFLLNLVFALAFALVLDQSANAQPSSSTSEFEIRINSRAVSPDERTAVACSSESPDVIVYDLEARKVRGVLNHFITPRNILFEPAGRFFYISDSTLGVVEKIDAASLKTISVLHASPGAFGIAISKDGRTLYVSNEAASLVWAFDLVSERPIALTTAYSQLSEGAQLWRESSQLYVIDFWNDKIKIVDTAANRISGEISGFHKIRAISITRDGKTIFAANSGTNSIAVVDVLSRSIMKQIPVGSAPQSVALSRDERFVCSGNPADHTITIVALSSFQVISTISGFLEPPQAVVFTEGSSEGYVPGGNDSSACVNLWTNSIAYTTPSDAGIEVPHFLTMKGELP